MSSPDTTTSTLQPRPPAHSPRQEEEQRGRRVNNSHFVTEEFHTKHRDKNGHIIITEENQEEYEDQDYLIKKYHEEGWATQKGVLYTRQMTNCPSGKGPTAEILSNMNQFMKLKMAGRIIMDNGDVYDFDTQNTLYEIMARNDQRMIAHLGSFCKNQMEQWEDKIKSGLETPPEKFTFAESDVDGTIIPSGEYEKKWRTHKVRKDGVKCYSLCDNPKCCMAGHLFMTLCAADAFPKEECDRIMGFIRERPIYRHLDPMKGNFDICHYCAQRQKLI